MLSFDPQYYPYASRRSTVFAKNGMCCSTSPVVSQTGLNVLKNGGTAVDAALSMAALIPLAEPTSNGLGADCFVLLWQDGKLYGLNGSGIAPAALSAEYVRSLGYEKMPVDGWLPVTVPGAVGAWGELHKRFGTKPLEELFAPAVQYAEEGYCVPVTAAALWKNAVKRFTEAEKKAPGVFKAWFDAFTKNGEPYRAGDVFRWPAYAETVRSLIKSNCRSLYEGDLMRAVTAEAKKQGGYLTEADFAAYKPEWVEPIHTNYRGYDVWEMPPNGHGIAVLMALNILKGFAMPREKESPETYHLMIEAMKLAFADTMKYVSDPRTMELTTEELLSESYAEKRRALIGKEALVPAAGDPKCGGTVYFCTADKFGNMVSFIQSNYNGFGSGIVIPGTGLSLQNRGANFSLEEDSPNRLAGHKRSYHTIIPGFLTKDGQPVGPFGVMGAFMQPQGHLQVIVNTVDYHMNPQASLDAPRFQWLNGKKIELEKAVPDTVKEALRARGHEVSVPENSNAMGRGQIIWRREDGVLAGATEPRSDGTVAAW